MQLFISKFLFLLFTLTFFSTQLLSASYNCNGQNIANINGTTTDATKDYSENTWGKDKARYFKFKTAVDGVITITLDRKGKKSEIKISDASCNDDNIYKEKSNNTISIVKNISKNKRYFIKIQEKNSLNNLKFKINFIFTAVKNPLPPTISSIPDQTATINNSYTLDISTYTTEDDGDEVTYAIDTDTIPTGLSFNTTSGILSGTPTVGGTYDLTVTATDKDGNASETFQLVISKTPSNTTSTADICYDEPYAERTSMISMCFSFGGLNCRNVIPIKNSSGQDLTNLNVYLTETGFNFNFQGTAGVKDGEGTASTKSDIEAGPISLLNKAVEYQLNDMPGNTPDDTRDTYTEATVAFDFSSSVLYSTYTKNGTDYNVEVRPCDENFIVPQLSVSDENITSSSSEQTMQFTIDIDPLMTTDIQATVWIKTVDGNATAGTDYTAIADTQITLPSNRSSITVEVPILANGSGNFYLILEKPYNSGIFDGNATGFINKDSSPNEPEDETIPSAGNNLPTATCNTFADGLQTRGDNSSVDFSEGSAKLYNNPDSTLNTYSTPVNGGSGNDLTCVDNINGDSDQSCQSSNSGATTIEEITLLYPAIFTLATPVTDSTEDENINSTSSPLTLSEYNRITSNWDSGNILHANFDITNQLYINYLKLHTDEGKVTFDSTTNDPYNITIGEFVLRHTTVTNDLNTKNIKIGILSADNPTNNLSLSASQTIKINELKTSHTSNYTLKAQYININTFTDNGSYVGGENTITLQADYIDIGDFTLSDVATLNIIPFTDGGKVIVKINQFKTGSKNTINFARGTYYIKTLVTSGSGAGYHWNMNGKVNLILEDDWDSDSEIAINADNTGGNNLENDPHNATTLFIYSKGNITTSNDTTIIGTIYSEKNIILGSSTYIKGALSAKNLITLGNGTKVYYDQTISGEGMGECGITIGFDKDEYQVKEDYNSFDNFTSVLEVNIILSTTLTSDVSVTYKTRDDTAIAGSTRDYISKTGTATIAAGETNTTIYIDIVHDIDIELDEHFWIDLSNINPANDSITMGINPVKITILAQEESDLPVCYTDNFTTALDDQWRTLRGKNYTPQVVDGRLRLTEGSGSIATAVTKDFEFASKYNMIVVEFEQYAYGGCMDSGAVGSGLGAYGADGIVAVLYDSDVGAEPTPGGLGGSMGYAQNNSMDGFQGGWLGLGLDEYGNFANPNEGREGGPGFRTNYAVIRGDGAGKNGYDFLAISNELSGVANKNTSTPVNGYKYKMITDARDPNHLYITLQRDTGSGYQVIINKFDAKDSQYNQSTTPDFVRFAFTSGTGGGCNRHEIDELSVRGYCQPYNPNPPSTVLNNSDIVDVFTDDVNYNLGSKFITTKVAGKTEVLTGVHLDDASRAVKFNSRDNLTFKIIPYISDSVCSTRMPILDTNGNPTVISITNRNTTGSANVVMPKEAKKDVRFSLSSLDFQQVYDNSNQQCLKNSTTTGNMQGIDQCIVTSSQYLLAFGNDTYYRCYKDDATDPLDDAANYGEPCNPTNNGRGNQPYDSNYGCLMCTIDTASTCSSDNFALRPDGIDISSSNTKFPDLFRAGEKYAFKLQAYNYNNIKDVSDVTRLYSITDAQNIFSFTKILQASDGTEDASMAGSVSWDQTADFDMLNGLSIDIAASNEVAELTFDNVGKVEITVLDTDWADVDLTDERGMQDPSNTLYNNCNPDGAYICGKVDTAFIPHHFSFTTTSIANNNANPGAYTYYSTLTPGTPATYAMTAKVLTTVSAQNKSGGITTNFTAGSYENPIHIALAVNNAKLGAAAAVEIGDGTQGGNTLLSFINGAYSVPWNETNNSKSLLFNFPRASNNALNPVQILPGDINLGVVSIFTGAAAESPANITSDTSGDGTINGNILQSATFIYGRTNAPRQRFEGTDGNTFIYYEAYCSGIDANGVNCNKALLPNGNTSTSSDDPRWFINTSHASATEGTAGVVTQKSAGFVTAALNPDGYPRSTVNLVYDETRGYPYKATMLNTPSAWLVYDPFVIRNQNEFQVEFTNTDNNWAGQDTTDNDTGVQGTDRTNRRSMW